MSTPRDEIPDELLYAYVDGEIDAPTAARVEAAIEGDPRLARRVAQQRDLRARLQRRFDVVLEEPVPQRLQSAITRSEGGWSWREWGAMAATLVLGALIGPQFLGGTNDLPLTARAGQLIATGDLGSALTSQLSEASGPGAVDVSMSIRTAGGELCRSFQLATGQAGLACRRGDAWVVEVLSAATAESGEYRQASSILPEPVRRAIEARSIGEPLTSAEERAQLDSRWQGAPNPQD